MAQNMVTYFNDFLKKIRLTENQVNELKSAHTKLRERLMAYDDLKEIIDMNHCNYIYVDSSYKEDKSIFSDIVGDSFEYDVLFSLSGETY